MDTSRRLKAGTQASFAGTSIGHAGHCVPADLLAAQRPLVLQCQGNGEPGLEGQYPGQARTVYPKSQLGGSVRATPEKG